MINFNGEYFKESDTILTSGNRAFKYGDGLFETIKVLDAKIVFLEDHYFRLMASMRMLRMEISMNFTLEYFEKQIIETVKKNDLKNARIRFSVFRNEGGLYTPLQNSTKYLVEVNELKVSISNNYEVDLYKDFYISSGFLSTLKTTNRILNVMASIYAKENSLNNCILVNEKKHIVEATNGNIFLVKGNVIKTPALSEGAIKGIARKKIIEIVNSMQDFELVETEISPFELQKSDEVFITNAIIGIQPITKYRKTEFSIKIGLKLREKLASLI
jgi:branched-chain amino acid aminotransferase